MKVIFFLQYGSMGSSSKYRILLYKDEFDKRYITKYCYFWDNKYVAKYMANKKKYVFHILLEYMKSMLKRLYHIFFIVPKYDVLVIQRCIIPYIPFTFLNYVKRRGVKIVYDIDDALHLNKKYNCDQIGKSANCVIVGSRALKEHYKTLNMNVKFVPTVDNDLLYESHRKDTFSNKCIGWIGSFSTIQNFELIVEAVNRLIEEKPETYVKIISDDIRGYDKKIKNCKFVKWSGETYKAEMEEFTIGIMPLIDNEFNKGKCGFKLIQYLDLEKPVIASDLGENIFIVRNFGCVCHSSEEWYRYLRKLLFDENYYRECVFNIRNDFINYYGYEKTFEKLDNIISRC